MNSFWLCFARLNDLDPNDHELRKAFMAGAGAMLHEIDLLGASHVPEYSAVAHLEKLKRELERYTIDPAEWN